MTLPAEWVKTNGIKAGEEVQTLDNKVLIVFPPNLKDVNIDNIITDIRGAFAFLKR